MAAANNPTDIEFYESWFPTVKAALVKERLWDVVENGIPLKPSEDLVSKDMKARQVLLCSLPDLDLVEFLSGRSAKDVWDMLEEDYEEEKLRTRLNKEFEELSMEEGETLDFYLDRVMEIVKQLRLSKHKKSNEEVVKKVLGSLSGPYEDVATLVEKILDVETMSLNKLVDVCYKYESITEDAMALMLKGMSLEPESKGGGAREARPRTNECFLCGEGGHYARDCKIKDQVRGAFEEKGTEGVFKYDEDMWILSGQATNHMTPYEKVFTTLDRTHKGNVGLVDGSVVMAQGKGDVKVVMKEGKKKTISNVLFVPDGINGNVLSVPQMTSKGCSFNTGEGDECIVRDRSGAVFGDAMWDERGLCIRLQVVKANLTS